MRWYWQCISIHSESKCKEISCWNKVDSIRYAQGIKVLCFVALCFPIPTRERTYIPCALSLAANHILLNRGRHRNGLFCPSVHLFIWVFSQICLLAYSFIKLLRFLHISWQKTHCLSLSWNLVAFIAGLHKPDHLLVMLHWIPTLIYLLNRRHMFTDKILWFYQNITVM